MLSLDWHVPESLANFITDIRPLAIAFDQEELLFWKEAQMSGAVDRIAGAAGERAGFRPAAPRFDAEGSEGVPADSSSITEILWKLVFSSLAGA